MGEFDQLINQTARKYGLPPGLLRRLVRQESGFNPRAVSPAGAQGLTQLMPATARGLGVTDPFNAQQNLDGGARYLSDQYKKFGRWDLALSAYNSGPGGSESAGRVEAFPETQNYVKSILSGWTPGAPAAAAPPQPRIRQRRPVAQPSLADGPLADVFKANQELIGIDPVDLGALMPRRKARPVALAAAPAGGGIPVVAEGKPSKNAGEFAELVQHYLGTPYAWGGGGPGGPSKGFGRGANTVGFDCSSFLQFLWAKQGVEIPRVTYDQWRAGKAVGRGQLREGDAVFFRPGPRGPEHVGVYLGNGKFAHAPKTGDVIKISSLGDSYYRSAYMGARRFG